MGLPSFLLGLTVLWLAIHSLPALLHRIRASASRTSLLPAPLLSQSQHASTFTTAPTTLYRSDTTSITLSPFHIRLSTTALNAAYDRLAGWLVRAPRTRRALSIAYDLGTVVGVLGMILSIGCAAWTCFQLAGLLFATPTSAEPPNGLAKRSWEDAPAGDIPYSDSGLQLHILIPGITLPLSHLPPLFLGLVFSQAFHEAGHVLCAALDQIPLQSLGASFALLFPSLFTALPATTSARLPAAGPLHNLILFLLLLLPLPLPIPKSDALAVTAVDSGSALVDFVRRGDVIVALDDTHLDSADTWHEYLLHGNPQRESGMGWCTDASLFLSQPSICCDLNSGESPDACFTYTTLSEPHLTVERCIDPLPLLAPSMQSDIPARCSLSSAAPNTRGQKEESESPCACVRPRPDQQLLRLVLASGEKGIQRVILWRGPRWEVYEQISVSSSHFTWMPLWVSDAIDLFLTYTRTLSLTLFILNLLPLAPLDGSHLLDALLSTAPSATDIELDDVETGKTRRRRPVWIMREGRRVCSAVKRATQALVGTGIALGVLVVLREGM